MSGDSGVAALVHGVGDWMARQCESECGSRGCCWVWMERKREERKEKEEREEK